MREYHVLRGSGFVHPSIQFTCSHWPLQPSSSLVSHSRRVVLSVYVEGPREAGRRAGGLLAVAVAVAEADLLLWSVG